MRGVVTGMLVALAGVLLVIAGGLFLILVRDVTDAIYPGAGPVVGFVLCVVAYGGFAGWFLPRAFKGSEEDPD